MRLSAWLGRMASLALMACLTLAPGISQAEPGFGGWASIVLAGDWRDGRGQPIEAFDNARRDLSRAVLERGFATRYHASLTLNPAKPDTVSPVEALRQIETLTRQAPDGCLFYLTSHGLPSRLTFGDTKGIEPVDLARMLRQWCGTRPTVVVLSACYSGTFVDGLKAPNRMIMTAARRDRTSFGCGVDETYPWFDACVLDSLPEATHFLELARLTRECVTRREAEAKVTLPSEPQVFVGAEMQIRLPTLRFDTSP